ncbi:MAG: hypothetical protein GX868_01330, partial [Actinobacteria bacterium]|nr:hypothetical protein [Actinomycetota bacterium]
MTFLKLSRTMGTRPAAIVQFVPAEALADTEFDLNLLKRLSFEGKVGQSATLTSGPSVVVLCGAGEPGEITTTDLRKAMANAVRALSAHPTVVVDLSLAAPMLIEHLTADDMVQAIGEGGGLGAYHFGTYKTSDKAFVDTVQIVSTTGKAGLARAQRIVEAVHFARDLVNEPGGTLTPAVFADRVKAKA